jgi:hypothetical protein
MLRQQALRVGMKSAPVLAVDCGGDGEALEPPSSSPIYWRVAMPATLAARPVA